MSRVRCEKVRQQQGVLVTLTQTTCDLVPHSNQLQPWIDGWKGTDGWLGPYPGSIGTHQEYAAKSMGENGHSDGS
jgi:hypothetical protein